jgi:hypothetical protein
MLMHNKIALLIRGKEEETGLGAMTKNMNRRLISIGIIMTG